MKNFIFALLLCTIFNSCSLFEERIPPFSHGDVFITHEAWNISLPFSDAKEGMMYLENGSNKPDGFWEVGDSKGHLQDAVLVNNEVWITKGISETSIVILDGTTQGLIERIDHEDKIRNIEILDENRLVIMTSEESLIYDITTRELLSRIPVGCINCEVEIVGENFVISAFSQFAASTSLSIFSLADYSLQGTVKEIPGTIRSLYQDGDFLFMSGHHNTIDFKHYLHKLPVDNLVTEELITLEGQLLSALTPKLSFFENQIFAFVDQTIFVADIETFTFEPFFTVTQDILQDIGFDPVSNIVYALVHEGEARECELLRIDMNREVINEMDVQINSKKIIVL